MDDSTFDQFTRLAAPSRRALVQTIAAAAVALTGLTALSRFDPAEAKKRGGKGKHHRCKPKHSGTPCTSSKDCCPEKSKRVCRMAPADLGMQKVCCGGQGASCEGDNFCCLGFGCTIGSHRCERVA
jgi:hypothetical protein